MKFELKLGTPKGTLYQPDNYKYTDIQTSIKVVASVAVMSTSNEVFNGPRSCYSLWNTLHEMNIQIAFKTQDHTRNGI